VEPVLLPPRSPNLNAHLERFHRSLKEELLDGMIFFGETALRNAVTWFSSIITLNEITRGWQIGSSNRVRKSASPAAKYGVAS
jgi:transposase InsO family protein